MRTTLEFGVVLAPHHEGMPLHFHDLRKACLRPDSREDKTFGLKLLFSLFV